MPAQLCFPLQRGNETTEQPINLHRQPSTGMAQGTPGCAPCNPFQQSCSLLVLQALSQAMGHSGMQHAHLRDAVLVHRALFILFINWASTSAAAVAVSTLSGSSGRGNHTSTPSELFPLLLAKNFETQTHLFGNSCVMVANFPWQHVILIKFNFKRN